MEIVVLLERSFHSEILRGYPVEAPHRHQTPPWSQTTCKWAIGLTGDFGMERRLQECMRCKSEVLMTDAHSSPLSV